MKKAIVARIFGGLGNQLFIYANARAIALRNGAKLYLDTTTGFRDDPYRRFWCLGHFNVQYCEAGLWRSFDFFGGKLARRLTRDLNRGLGPYNYLTERNFERFDPAITRFNVHRLTWVEGYWQSPRYFEDVAPEIRKELQITTPPGPDSLRVAGAMHACNAVCLHARRLRNVLVGEAQAKIKTLGPDYYRRAIARMAEQVDNPHFFCFSDDPAWLKAELDIPFPHTLVTHNHGDEKNFEDLWLMQQCRHFILSNSTFPWWAAWLGNAADKIVLAPGLEYWDCKDILAEGWEVVD